MPNTALMAFEIGDRVEIKPDTEFGDIPLGEPLQGFVRKVKLYPDGGQMVSIEVDGSTVLYHCTTEEVRLLERKEGTP